MVPSNLKNWSLYRTSTSDLLEFAEISYSQIRFVIFLESPIYKWDMTSVHTSSSLLLSVIFWKAYHCLRAWLFGLIFSYRAFDLLWAWTFDFNHRAWPIRPLICFGLGLLILDLLSSAIGLLIFCLGLSFSTGFLDIFGAVYLAG